MRLRPRARAALITLVFFASLQARAQTGHDWSADPLGSLVGDWSGEGIVYGDHVSLTRAWEPHLAKQEEVAAFRFERIDSTEP